jgi:hypothetical protein
MYSWPVLQIGAFMAIVHESRALTIGARPQTIDRHVVL